MIAKLCLQTELNCKQLSGAIPKWTICFRTKGRGILLEPEIKDQDLELGEKESNTVLCRGRLLPSIIKKNALKISSDNGHSKSSSLSSKSHVKEGDTRAHSILYTRFCPWDNDSRLGLRLNGFMYSEAWQGNGCFPALWSCILHGVLTTFRGYLCTLCQGWQAESGDVRLKSQIYGLPCSIGAIFEYVPSAGPRCFCHKQYLLYCRTLQSLPQGQVRVVK